MESQRTTLGAEAKQVVMVQDQGGGGRWRGGGSGKWETGRVRQIDPKRGSESLSLPCLDLYFSCLVCQTERGRGWNNNSGVM